MISGLDITLTKEKYYSIKKDETTKEYLSCFPQCSLPLPPTNECTKVCCSLLYSTWELPLDQLLTTHFFGEFVHVDLSSPSWQDYYFMNKVNTLYPIDSQFYTFELSAALRNKSLFKGENNT